MQAAKPKKLTNTQKREKHQVVLNHPPIRNFILNGLYRLLYGYSPRIMTPEQKNVLEQLYQSKAVQKKLHHLDWVPTEPWRMVFELALLNGTYRRSFASLGPRQVYWCRRQEGDKLFAQARFLHSHVWVNITKTQWTQSSAERLAGYNMPAITPDLLAIAPDVLPPQPPQSAPMPRVQMSLGFEPPASPSNTAYRRAMEQIAGIKNAYAEASQPAGRQHRYPLDVLKK